MKANNMLVLPAILPEEATFIGGPVFGSEPREKLSLAEQAKYVPPIY